MIHVKNVTKRYPLQHGRDHRVVLSNVNFLIKPGEKWGILGRNGAGKSTLVRLISGAERPNSGQITRDMSISWPLAFGDAFQSSLTGRDNLKLICRAYRIDFDRAFSFVEDFAELGPYIREPIKNYSSGMSARLAFAISMVVEFDCYLIDEVVAVGDYRFVEKCETELFSRRKDRAMIMVSHNAEFIQKHCEKVAVLHQGNLTLFDDVADGNAYYLSL